MITEENLSALGSIINSLLHTLEKINDEGLPDDIEVTGDSDDVEYFLDCVGDFCDSIAYEVNDWLDARQDGTSVISSINDLLEGVNYSMEEIELGESYFLTKIETLISLTKSIVKDIESDPAKDSGADRSYYVYTHVNTGTGEVFYVGKGKNRRAWSKNRQKYWKEYVEKIDGKYDVKIVKDKLTERDAEYLEDNYLKKHKDTVINLQTYSDITLSLDEDLNYSVECGGGSYTTNVISDNPEQKDQDNEG